MSGRGKGVAKGTESETQPKEESTGSTTVSDKKKEVCRCQSSLAS